jgi:hypothetical protein
MQAQDILEREVDRLDIAGLILGHALPLRGIGVVIGENLERLTVLCDNALPDVVYALANLICGHDPQLAPWKLLHEHRGARDIALSLELSRDRDHVAVADTANLDDLHESSIYMDSR